MSFLVFLSNRTRASHAANDAKKTCLEFSCAKLKIEVTHMNKSLSKRYKKLAVPNVTEFQTNFAILELLHKTQAKQKSVPKQRQW